MNLAVAAGGSGHHAFLSLTIVDALRRAGVIESACYLGASDAIERSVVDAASVPRHPIYQRRSRGAFGSLILANALPVAAAVPRAVRTLRALGVTAVLSTGGLPSLPVVLAARLLRLPVILFVAEVRPPLGFRVQARLAALVAASTEEGAGHLAGRPVVTGHPVRQEFWDLDREQSRKRLGLSDDEQLLLISVGTAALRLKQFNDWAWKDAPMLLEQARVFQITGGGERERLLERRATLPPRLQERWTILEFSWDLPAAMLAADLGILRCGAAIVGELPAAALPSILVPRAKSTGNHQEHNARYFTERGCARMLPEGGVAGAAPLALQLLGDPAGLAAMRSRLSGLRRPGAADEIAAAVASRAPEWRR